MKRSLIIVIQKKHQGISLSLATCVIHFELEAELTFKECGDKRGAEREFYIWQIKTVLCEVEISLVGTEGDECRAPG